MSLFTHSQICKNVHTALLDLVIKVLFYGVLIFLSYKYTTNCFMLGWM